MKKLIVFIFFLASLSLTSLIKNEQNPIWGLEIDQVCFVSEDVISDNNVECGDLIFNFVDKENAKKNYKNLKKSSKNVQFYVKSNDINKILNVLKFETLDSQSFDGQEIYVGVSPYFDDYKFVENFRFNLQISVTTDQIIVASPAILTGF